MNETSEIRKGEEIDRESLGGFLQKELPEFEGGIVISQFPGGASNLTYLVTIGSEEYVLRRPPFGNTVKSAHDMQREFSVLEKLSKVYPAAPKPLVYCGDESVIGSEFYLMERKKGLIIRGKMPAVSQDGAGKIAESFISNLAALHSLDIESAGLAGFGKPEGYARRQVEGWAKRYFNAKTHEWPELESAIKWLSSQIPEENEACLIHNDYKFDNIILDPGDLTKIVGVLDWEMATIGCPLMDLGTSLGYWMGREAGEEMLNMPFNPRLLMENISRRQLVDIYAEKTGRDVSNMLYYYVFGTFKIAVIAQQIYARYAKGLTKDGRFAGFYKFVAALGAIAFNAIEREKI